MEGKGLRRRIAGIPFKYKNGSLGNRPNLPIKKERIIAEFQFIK